MLANRVNSWTLFSIPFASFVILSFGLGFAGYLLFNLYFLLGSPLFLVFGEYYEMYELWGMLILSRMRSFIDSGSSSDTHSITFCSSFISWSKWFSMSICSRSERRAASTVGVSPFSSLICESWSSNNFWRASSTT